jgi:hypothetical protein
MLAPPPNVWRHAPPCVCSRLDLSEYRPHQSDAHMDITDTPTKQGDIWSWVVIGLVFCGVTAALYGPFIWELTHSV